MFPQDCAERLEILEDGSIPQMSITSYGLIGGSLEGKGIYPVAICCNIYGDQLLTFSNLFLMGKKRPYITQDASDWFSGDGENPQRQ